MKEECSGVWKDKMNIRDGVRKVVGESKTEGATPAVDLKGRNAA